MLWVIMLLLYLHALPLEMAAIPSFLCEFLLNFQTAFVAIHARLGRSLHY
jgi:hypothetical protein